ncbi:MAG: cation diffusion facilitator family transporter, partial [Cyanobacteria bacterium KgW148]|nr:cation diffusion facilitator family transporter [Cyanobacteria bacterium KgW148]
MISDNRSEVQRVLLLTLGLNLIVLVIKIVVSWANGSLSLLADALHSVTDSANNVVGLVAVKFASPLPDRDHPYGHHKFEAVGAIAIAAFLAIACLEIIKGVISSLFKLEHKIQLGEFDLWFLLLVLGINIFVAFYERHVGKKVGSAILVADSHHTMADIWITIGVIASLAIINTGISWLQWLDLALAIPVSILVLWSGYQILVENIPILVDKAAIPPEKIYDLVMTIEGVINCHDIASRGVLGRQLFIEMHLV